MKSPGKASPSAEPLMAPFLSKNKKKYLIGITALLFINILQLAVPRITGNVIDRIESLSINGSQLLTYSGIILLIALMVFVLNYLSRVCIIGSSNLFELEIRSKLFRHLLDLSMDYYSRKGVGDIMALSVNDVGAIRMAMGRGIQLVADTIFKLIFSIVIMSRAINLHLTLIVIIPFPLMVFVMVRFGGVIHSRFKRVQESFADLTRKVQENISGIRVIKAFSQEDEEIENFRRINEENYRINMRLVRIQSLFFPLISFLSSISFLLVLIYGGTLVARQEISLGDFVAFNSYIGILIRPITSIGRIINFIQRGKASMERIQELLGEKPKVYDNNKSMALLCTKSLDKLQGRIEFKNLSFAYEEGQEPVLKDITLTLEPGKTLAIIGRVGSGKSTLASLLLRLYNPPARGQLLVDGMDILDIPLKFLRENIGYVPQDNFLFSSSIKDNIAFMPQTTDMSQVENAAKISQIYDNIIEFPDGFGTILGERGVNVSGGQKQRLSIARALIKNPSILILDDCLSSVDTQTEEKILEGLKKVMHSRTCIMIAHRISTIKDADEIIVLDHGRIMERGTHLDLLEQNGIYSQMYEKQLLEEKVANA
jgi:ATP-binding cassette subfamily B multidrug efflux pump